MSVLTREMILLSGLAGGRLAMSRTIMRIRDGHEIEASDLQFIANAFERILAGENPKSALQIEGARSEGRKRTGQQVQKEEEFAAHVARLRDEEKMKLEDALESAAKTYCISPSSAEKYQKKHGKKARYYRSAMAKFNAQNSEYDQRVSGLPDDVKLILKNRSFSDVLNLLRERNIDGDAPTKFILDVRNS